MDGLAHLLRERHPMMSADEARQMVRDVLDLLVMDAANEGYWCIRLPSVDEPEALFPLATWLSSYLSGQNRSSTVSGGKP
jgi:hypothetical protein